ncbi:uncharacterized protein LOC121646305 [Melanotaenia boesemani]|uniref:uncharacterized protein LOC121646304 n=1 Tax=Melanotaenia boesemani TaxID=1250792 RepID=UPI001C05450B|nr:uncharacterized protein LOC121646304 [Melanotaenia boesemani]XP_041851155.1 uncharacterized protein LOC121646305 [Melanotaenia boesemani]
MVTAGFFLRVSIFALLTVAACGYPQKGTHSTGHSSSGANPAAGYTSYQGGAPSFAAAPYHGVGGAYGGAYVPSSSVYQPVLAAPGFSSSGSPAAVQAAGVSPAAQMGPASTLMAGLPGAAYVTSPQLYVPVAEYNAGTQDEPETQWTVPTTVFSEAGSAGTQAVGDLPSARPAPRGPTLQSGETSSVVKEAELGNYQQQTEDFGYPDLAGSGQGFGQGLATVLVPGVQMGGFRPASAGRFDRMLLYGLYPPGSYSSFSQHHEAGKDYSQAIHYLKEHVTESHGSGQQKKFFQGAH